MVRPRYTAAGARAARSRRTPCVLVLAGLDPGGGAGLLADARAVHAAGAFACGVATLLTTQSTRGLRRVVPLEPRIWVEQVRAALAQHVRAIKVGALGTVANVRATARLLASVRVPVVVDPVLLPTRGRVALLTEGAVGVMKRQLLPQATLVTANAHEASVLTDMRVTRQDEAVAAGHALVALGATAALVKGGHLPGTDATDVLVIGREVTLLRRRRLKLTRRVHGGGCTLASLVAGRLALGHDLLAAVRWAKSVHHRALEHALDVGGELAVLDAGA